MKKAAATSNITMIGIGMKRIGRFTIIDNGGNFAIRPRLDPGKAYPEKQTYSHDLYIKTGFHLDESSPLKKFIDMGLIVESTNASPKKGYTAYTFFRPLVDSINYDENGDDRLDDMEVKPLNPHIPDPEIKNENDCLKFGEAMGIAIRYGNIDNVINHLQTDETDPKICLREDSAVLFGESITKNRKLYEKAGPINNHAIPEPGQSYAIVRKSSKKNRKGKIVADYHIAFVIYQEGGINITLEAEANAGREYFPHFSFYDTNPDGYTFHRRWAGLLPGDKEQFEADGEDEDGNEITYTTSRYEDLYNNGNTIVLQPASTPIPTPIPTPSAPVGTKRKRGTGGKSMKKLTLRKQNKNTTIKAK